MEWNQLKNDIIAFLWIDLFLSLSALIIFSCNNASGSGVVCVFLSQCWEL
jgi:hypothetical protein